MTLSSASTARPSPSVTPPAEAAAPVGAPPETRTVVGVRFHVTDYADATHRVMAWAARGESRAVYCSNTHSVVEGEDNLVFRELLNRADLNTPDGVPVVWAMRHQGADATRVYGPDLTLHVLRAAAEASVPVAFYGSSPETLEALSARLPTLAPGLDVRAMVSPPYRDLTPSETEGYLRELQESGARIVFVGLGCPRQERWCDVHRGRLPAVMLAVGAAFDFHAGRVRQAPPLLQRVGMEWAFRLVMEPRRLWRRYAHVVPRFLAGYWRQVRHGTGAREHGSAGAA